MAIKKRKIPYYFLLFLLTTGASLIIGLLSFGGMYAILPIIPIAIASLTLSVAYEGEVYLQNLKGAFKKLFKPFHIQRELTKKFLLDFFPEDIDSQDCPQFFKDYANTLRLLHNYEDKRLSKEDTVIKYRLEKRLNAMEKWFAKILFTKDNFANKSDSKYVAQIQLWLAKPELNKAHQQLNKELNKRKHVSIIAQVFSGVCAIFMGAGTTYLLTETFVAIPLLAGISVAAWPLMIVPMALIAGSAYGFLTYNAVTDMINNKTIQKWFYYLKNEFKKGFTLHNTLLGLTTILLSGLAVGLTICTMGTWWTVVKNSQPLFSWMKKIPGFIMGVINPVVIGASSVIVNLENTFESLNLFKNLPKIFSAVWKNFTAGLQELKHQENSWQIFNPFRIILKLTITPLRILLFLGHLISIGVTSDRVPGFSQVISALFGIISEGFEDLHYFVDMHTNEQSDNLTDLLSERLEGDAGHDHSLDMPTLILKTLFSPIYFLAALWDHIASKKNTNLSTVGTDVSASTGVNANTNIAAKKSLTLKEAFDKQWYGSTTEDIIIENKTAVSTQWQCEQTKLYIERLRKKGLSPAEKNAIDVLEEEIDTLNSTATVANVSSNNTTDAQANIPYVTNTEHVGQTEATHVIQDTANDTIQDGAQISSQTIKSAIINVHTNPAFAQRKHTFFKTEAQIFVEQKLPGVLNDEQFDELRTEQLLVN